MKFSDFVSGIKASSQVFGAGVRRRNPISLLFHSKRTVFTSKDLYQEIVFQKALFITAATRKLYAIEGKATAQQKLKKS